MLARVGGTAMACGIMSLLVSPLSSVISAWNSPIIVSVLVPLPLKHPSIVCKQGVNFVQANSYWLGNMVNVAPVSMITVIWCVVCSVSGLFISSSNSYA